MLYQSRGGPVIHKNLFSWYVRTDPRDVARVEKKTVISTQNQRETIPKPKDGMVGCLGKWISPENLEQALNERMPGCMKGAI